jgi:hypothetical protein
MEDYCLMHMTRNLTQILSDGYIYSLEKLKKDGKGVSRQNAMDIQLFSYFTLMKKKNIPIMEAINHSFHCGAYYLIFDSKILLESKFYINKDWYVLPDDDVIDGRKNKENLVKILEPYSNHIKNEVLFKNKVSLKKYLREIHIPIKNKIPININNLVELIKKEYKNVNIYIIQPKKFNRTRNLLYFMKNQSLPK